VNMSYMDGDNWNATTSIRSVRFTERVERPVVPSLMISTIVCLCFIGERRDGGRLNGS
jgi:hypothetical protein